MRATSTPRPLRWYRQSPLPAHFGPRRLRHRLRLVSVHYPRPGVRQHCPLASRQRAASEIPLALPRGSSRLFRLDFTRRLFCGWPGEIGSCTAPLSCTAAGSCPAPFTCGTDAVPFFSLLLDDARSAMRRSTCWLPTCRCRWSIDSRGEPHRASARVRSRARSGLGQTASPGDPLTGNSCWQSLVHESRRSLRRAPHQRFGDG